jgi:hypothetical protein
MKNKIIMFVLLALILCCCNPNRSLEKQGNELVKKIEVYKEKNGELPKTLEDLGIKETLEGPLFYVKCDSVNYMVYYGTTLGESMYYYSDTKKWDYRLRGMGKNK